MKILLIGVRAMVAGMLVGLLAGPGTAAMICLPQIPMPRPTGPAPSDRLPLMGSEYQISGFNSRLPGSTEPATVRFDNVPERVGSYIVNESIHQFTNDEGKNESWIDFEFVRDPMTIQLQQRGSSEIAQDIEQRWRVNLADLELPKDATTPEFYMYFTEQGTPAPFDRRRRRGTDEFTIGAHPFLDSVNVWRGSTAPIKEEDLPPGANNALITNFEHYFTTVHDVERGLGVSTGVDGFHIGYRVVNIPEPTSCMIALVGIASSAWMLQRRRIAGSDSIDI
jgi:hypothetical protein